MRLTFSLSLAASILSNHYLVQAAASSSSPSSSSSSVYLLPSDESDSGPQSISNSQFASVLAHHLNVAGHQLGHFTGKDSKLWNWLPSNHPSPSDSVAQLFQENKDEINLVFHVKGAQLIHGLPANLPQTHSISNAAPPQAFDALLRTFSQSLGSISQGPLSVFNEGKAWLQQNFREKESSMMGKANVDQWDFVDESFSTLRSELSHLSDFFSSSIDATTSKVESLTVSGLLPIIETHGSTSKEYRGALDSLSKILTGGIQSLQSQSQDSKNVKVALILSPQVEQSLSKRSEDASDEELMKRYFEPRQYRTDAQPSTMIGTEKNNKGGEPQSDRELIRSCFKSQKELQEASADCSGNGDGKQSQIGGEMCWRCKCKKSWAGESCSRKDISAEFLLLGGTGLTLVLVGLGSLYVLAAEGSKELPGVLAGIQVPTLTRN